MRIALINTLYPPHLVGGAERSVHELARGLAGRGHAVAVLTLSPDGPVEVMTGVDGVEVHRIALADDWPFGEAAADRGAVRRLGWHVREARRRAEASAVATALRTFWPDVVSTHNIAGFGTRVWGLLPGVPHVHTLRDYYLLCVRTTRYRESSGPCARTCLDCAVLTRPRRRARRHPEVVVGLTHHVVDVHRAAGVFPAGQVYRVIGNDPSPVEVPHRLVTRLRAVGYLGRLERAKGLPLLLEAARMGELDGIELVVAGSGTGDQEAAVRALVDRGVAVTFLGQVPPADVLSRVDVLAVPTQWAEPFGRVAAEARAAGVPVLAADVGGLPESLAGYERSRLVTRYQDPLAWAEALRDWRAGWQPVAVGGRPPTTSYPGVTVQYEDLYHELLG